jgi:regulator of protease activity HflC (stomatin/prohibitin superfamily)
MTEFLRLLLDAIAYIWPLRIVRHWERGGYYVLGRWWKEVKPGVYPVVPWFTEVLEVSMAEAIVGTGRQDITLADGSMLSFSATATVKVVDPYKALNAVNDYDATMQELLSSVLAERLAAVDAERLTPDKRGRLMPDLRRWLGDEALEYGIEVKRVRFTSFVTNVKTHRLLIDQAATVQW